MRLAILVAVYATINVTGLLLLRRGMSDATSLTTTIGESEKRSIKEDQTTTIGGSRSVTIAGSAGVTVTCV